MWTKVPKTYNVRLTADVNKESKTSLTINLALKIFHKTKKTRKLYYTEDDPNIKACKHTWVKYV